MPLATGQTLSFYEILGPLGAGGMGEVYRARDTRLEREVAIKVLPEELAGDDEHLRRLEREAKTLASLNHPNVAGIHGVDREGDVSFLALELVPGEDLATRLARGPLPMAEAIDVCRQIAEGLGAAHEAGVIHRDLKPANVRITPEGVVKLLDFGLAKPIQTGAKSESASGAEPDSFLMTEEGIVLGTPTYMSPEQACGKPVDGRTDIWAFGCVLFECLTGKRAYGGGSVAEILAAVLERGWDRSALPSATPATVRELLESTLTKDPSERLPEIGEARLTLARAGVRATSAGTFGSRRSAGIVAGVVVLALLLYWLADPLAKGPVDGGAIIAVLPFENLSGDPDTGPFVKGLHEDLIIRLSNVDGLRVLSKLSAARIAETSLSVQEITEEYGVTTFLQASVQRSGSTVKLTARLIDGATDSNLWADAFDGDFAVEDVFDVQARLVEQVATQLALKLTAAQLTAIQEHPTADPEAFELYVRGRDSWLGLTDLTLNRALEYFSDAITRDPSFARAHSAIADTYLAMEFVGVLPLDEALGKAREAVDQALLLDPNLAEARGSLGHIYLHAMDGPQAERELLQSAALSPSFLDGHMFLGMAYLDWGRLDEAEDWTLAALKLDPMSTYGAWGDGLVRLALDDYEGAAKHFQRAVDLDGTWVGHYELAWALSALGDHERACQEIELALSNATGALAFEFGLRSTAVAFKAVAGDTAGAQADLRALDATSEAPFAMGLAHAALGDVDLAFDLWLNQTEWTILLPTHFRYGPMLDELRDDPRFQAVLDGIDEQWGW